MLQVQSSPLIWSTNVRSTRLYGQFLAGPNHRTLILISNPDIRSTRLYGQFSLDKKLTLQAGSTVTPKYWWSEKVKDCSLVGFYFHCQADIKVLYQLRALQSQAEGNALILGQDCVTVRMPSFPFISFCTCHPYLKWGCNSGCPH